MPDGGIDLEIRMQDAKLIASLLRSAGAQKQFTSEIDKTARESAKAEKELDRMAAATKKMVATPLEKYNAELAKLNTLQAKGKITAEEHARALAMAKVQLDSASGSMQKLSTSARDMGGGKQTIMDMASSLGIVTSASGAAAIAVQKLGEAFKFAHQQAKDAASESKSLATARANLVQISGGDAGKYKELQEQAKQLEEKGIGRQASMEMVFSAHSEGWAEELNQVADTHQVITDTKASSKVAGQVSGLFAEQGTKLGRLEAVDLTMLAAEKSRLDFAPLAATMIKGAEGAAPAGTSPAELAALASTLSSKYVSGEVTGERISSFGAAIAMDPELKGKGHMGAMRAIRDWSPEKRAEWLGKDQGRNLMYQGLQASEELITQRTAENEKEQADFRAGGGLIRRQVALTDADTTFKGLKNSQVEVNRLERVKEEKLSEHGLGVEAGQAKAEREQLQKNAGPIERYAGHVVAGGAAELGVSGKHLPAVSEIGGGAVAGGVKGVPGAMGGPMADQLLKAASMLITAATRLESAAQKQEKGSKHRAMQADLREPNN